MKIRLVIKRIIKNIFLMLAFPLYGLMTLLSVVGNTDSTFQTFSQILSLIPGKLGVYLRAAFYRLACPETSDEILIGFLTIFSHRDTSISKGVYIGPQCNIGKCKIGENTLVGSGVHILSGNRQHNFADSSQPIQNQGGSYRKIDIGEDCWVGNAALVMAPLADHTIVAAGSVVTKQSSEGDILVGQPAKPFGRRDLN